MLLDAFHLRVAKSIRIEIGNVVPVMLAQRIGEYLAKILTNDLESQK
jgi:site-specific DNA-cytosine methylase